MDDKPACNVFCLALLAAFGGKSVMATVLASDVELFTFYVMNDTITLHFHNDYR